MRFTDDDDPKVPRGPVRQVGPTEDLTPGRRADPLGIDPSAKRGRPGDAPGDLGAPATFGRRPPGIDLGTQHGFGTSDDRDYARFHDRVRQGRVKFCSSCGGVMRKSSRRILSAPSGAALVVFGALLMVAYGFATNFYQVPWFATFALPAAYYVGSIFVGVGILFFFIRERVWFCPTCREMTKR